MTSARGSTLSSSWPLGIARTCANGDGGQTVVTIGGVAYCGPCALAAVKARDAQEIA